MNHPTRSSVAADRVWQLLVLLASLPGAVAAASVVAAPLSALPERVVLNLTANPATRMAVTWRTGAK